MIKNVLGLLLAIVVACPLLAQENILKDFAESRRDKKYCLYPSTH